GFVDRLYAQNQFAIKLGLDAVAGALELEGHPERTHRCILVAGTNGKGETASFLSSILQAHGFRVGLYTSPHIIDLRERFRVDGRLMAVGEVHSIGRHVLERYGGPGDERPQLTFFELTTVMAAIGFSRSQVDVGVYEVGLGGRLDATNALPAELSVVTSVALDHTEYLGDDVESVAAEKAGIFRPGRPAVVGRQAYPAAQQTLEGLAPMDASFYGRHFRATADGVAFDDAATGDSRAAELPWARVDGAEVDVTGQPQPPTRLWNAACAAQAARRFLGESFAPDAAIRGLRASRWPGRLDRRIIETPRAGGAGRSRAYFFDAAHNPDGAAVLFDFLEERGLEIGAVVCGAMKNKDVPGIFARLSATWPVFACVLASERSASAEQLADALASKDHRATGTCAEMLERAQSVVDAAGQGSAILVFGSIYLLGECFETLGLESDSLLTNR
ncbi:MAG: bifunctional folylpolyglutamate synthase/dihydrofolate synthase, partial [Persicimonas sp.]